jgi:hypothetical protein
MEHPEKVSAVTFISNDQTPESCNQTNSSSIFHLAFADVYRESNSSVPAMLTGCGTSRSQKIGSDSDIRSDQSQRRTRGCPPQSERLIAKIAT